MAKEHSFLLGAFQIVAQTVNKKNAAPLGNVIKLRGHF